MRPRPTSAQPLPIQDLQLAAKDAARTWGLGTHEALRVLTPRPGSTPAAIYDLGPARVTLAAGDASGAGRRFLTAFAPVYGLTSADLAGMVDEVRPGLAGGQEVVVTQRVAGRRLYGARLRLHFARDGAFVAAVGTLYGGLRWEGDGKLSPDDAYRNARAFAAKLTGAGGSLSDGDDERGAVEEAAYPLGDVARPAWVVAAVAAPNGIDRFEMVVDAGNGRILEVAPLTWYADPQGQVFTASSPQPSLTPGVLPPVPDPPPYVTRAVVPFVGDAAFDQAGWVNATALSGNNATVRAHQGWTGGALYTTSGTAISAPGADFQFPLQLGPGQPDIRTYPEASGTNLFYLLNTAHDYFYALGFDESHGNFQTSTFGRGGIGNDAVFAFTQMGAGTPGTTPYVSSNAWMSIPRDGSIPVMGMYVWGPYTGDYYTDSSLDAEVVLHEFAHGVTARLGTGFSGPQGGAINEGNSDLFALNYLTGEDAPVDGSFAAAAYSSQAFATGLRTYPCSTQLAVNPLTYGSFGHVTSDGPEIHHDGEVWAVTMWDVRAALIARHGFSEGRSRVAQLLVDALQLAPDFPSMVAMRDALLAAERNRYAGADQDVLWQAFAKRGMGFMAAGGSALSLRVLADDGTPSPAAQLRLWESDLYLGEAVRLLVGDSNASAAPVVTFASSTGDSETVTLAQDGAVYAGEVAAGDGTPVPGNGVLELPPGSTLTVTTTDDDPGSGTASLNGAASVHAPYAMAEAGTLFDDGLATTLLGQADDGLWRHELPFPFSFFGVEHTAVWVSSNGFLTFGGGYAGWYESIDDPGALPFAAPFGTDLVSDGSEQPNEGVYVHDDVDRFTVLWKAEEYNGKKPVNVAVSLFPDGAIRFDYGEGNELWRDSGTGNHHAVVGLGRGSGTFSQAVSGHNGAVDLGDAPSIITRPAAPGEPEVAVAEGEHAVWSGQAAPVFFGGAASGGASPAKTFTVRNDGYATLTLGSLTVSDGFSLVEGLTPTLPPGDSDTFTVALDTTTAGTKTGAVSFATNDGDESPFTIPVSGVVGFVTEVTRCWSGFSVIGGTVRSELTISGQDVTITDVDVTLDISHTYDSDLDVYLLSPAGTRVELFTDVGGSGNGFSGTVLDDEATRPIAGSYAPFGGAYRPEGSLAALDGQGLNGAWMLEVSDYVAGDGGWLSSWCITATVASVDAFLGEVTVTAGPTAIVDGQSDAVSFDDGAQGQADSTRTFTVRNDGYGTLTLGTVTVPPGFTMTEALAPSLAPEAEDDFTVRLDTATEGTRSGDVSFATSDPDEDPFSFPITGTVLPAGTLLPCSSDVPKDVPDQETVTSELAVSGASTGITDVNVALSISHGRTSDLDVSLISPAGTRVKLFAGVGGNGADFIDTVLDDEAATEIGAGTAPFTGSFRPQGSLTTLDNCDPNGTWTLEVTDTYPMGGILRSWCLTVFTAAEPAPEISVLEGADVLIDGQVTPVSFGREAQGVDGPTRVFTVRNDGTATLALGAVVVPAGFTVTEGLGASLEPGESDTVTVQMETVTEGTKSGEVSITSSDADESPFTFPVTGTVLAAGTLLPCATDVPKAIPDRGTITSELAISDASSRITDVNVTLTITHSAESDLDVFLIGPTGARVELFTDVGGFGGNFTDTVLDDEAATKINAGTAPYTGAFRPEGSLAALDGASPNGTWTLEVTDDAYARTGTLVSWCLTIATTGEAAPEITVLDGGAALTAGQAGSIGFGFATLGAEGPMRTFTVRNDGTAELTLGAVAVPAGFAVAKDLNTSLPPGASDTFTVRLATATAGMWSGVVSLASNDPDESTFTFPVIGTVTTHAPCAADVPKAIPDKATVTSTLAIGGATAAITDANVALTITHPYDMDLDVFLISPTGTRVELFTDCGGSGDNFIDTVLDDEAATSILSGTAPFTGSFRPEGSLAALDGTSPNGTWTLEITDDKAGSTGTLMSWCLPLVAPGEPAPEITVLDGAAEITNGQAAPVSFGTVVRGSTAPTRTFTVRNDGTAALTLGAVSVPNGFAVTEGLAATLAPGTSDTFTVQLGTTTLGTKSGEVSFATNDGDENPFTFAVAGTIGGRVRRRL